MGLADALIERDLKLDGIAEPVLYAAGVGRPPRGTTWVPGPGRPCPCAPTAVSPEPQEVAASKRCQAGSYGRPPQRFVPFSIPARPRRGPVRFEPRRRYNTQKAKNGGRHGLSNRTGLDRTDRRAPGASQG